MLSNSYVDIQFSRESILCITKALYDLVETISEDLENFAHHAKRQTILSEDVLLCARRQPKLKKILEDHKKELSLASSFKPPANRKKKKSIKDKETIDVSRKATCFVEKKVLQSLDLTDELSKSESSSISDIVSTNVNAAIDETDDTCEEESDENNLHFYD